jgi:hypothetical protein
VYASKVGVPFAVVVTADEVRLIMAGNFKLDPKKTAEENICDFLAHIESEHGALGQILRAHIDKIFPLPRDATQRSAARAEFNSEVKKQLDAALAAVKSEHA